MSLKKKLVRKMVAEAVKRALESVRELQNVALQQFPTEAEVQAALEAVEDERAAVERTLRFVLEELLRVLRAAESGDVESAAASFYVNVLCNPYVYLALLKGVKDEYKSDYLAFYRLLFITLFPPSQQLPLSQRFLEELQRAAEEVAVESSSGGAVGESEETAGD